MRLGMMSDSLGLIVAVIMLLRGAFGSLQSVNGIRTSLHQEAYISEAKSKFIYVLLDVVRNSQIGCVFVEYSGHMNNMNEQFAKAAGWNRERLEGKTWMSITHPADLEPDSNYVLEMIDGFRTYYEMNKRYIGEDGLIYPVRLRVSVMLDQKRFFVTVTPYAHNVWPQSST